jgi:hypothetical protein
MTKPKIDLSEFFKLSRPKKKPCMVGFALTELTEEEGKQLAAAFQADKGIITASAIREWLVLRKHDVSLPVITSHRAGSCSCND